MNLINNKNKNNHIESSAGVYEIQYLDCNNKYVEESGQCLKNEFTSTLKTWKKET